MRCIDEDLDMPGAEISPSIDESSGVLDLVRAFGRGDATPDAYLAACVGRAAQVEPLLKAFTFLPSSYPPTLAGPLGGIPIGVKDIIATSDMPTTNGSPVYADTIPSADSWIVERLKAQGAVVFGKTVTTEFAWRHPGPTVNPWNFGHTPGGSSSGSAAAVAAGIVPLALGSQTLGSVIRPAAFNGIVGLKPSFGAVPRLGIHPLGPSLDHLGFFARCVDDVAYALSLLAGTHDRDLHGRALPAFRVSAEAGLEPLRAPRLALLRTSLWARVDPVQQDLFEATAATLQEAGAVVEEIELPPRYDAVWASIDTILSSEAGVIFAELVERFPDRTSQRLKELVERGRAMSAHDYVTARESRARLRTDFTDVLAGFDAVLTLPAFGEAPEGLGSTGDAEYCAPWTLLGVPAVSLPAGFGRKGLPLGIQIVGPYRQDLKLLRVAKWIEGVIAFERTIAGARKSVPLAFSRSGSGRA